MRRLPVRPRVFLPFLVLAVLASSAVAAPARRHAVRPRAKHAPVARAAAAPRPATPVLLPGMVIAIDPETGALVLPTPEQRLALTPAERTGLLRTATGLVEQRLPDGSVRVDLQGRFREFATISAGPAGRPLFGCVHDASALERLLAPVAPAPTPTYEER